MNAPANSPQTPPTGKRTENSSPRFERQKERILDAATMLLNQKGVWGMTLQEVAGALGLTTSSVTYYFKRRELLAAAVFGDSLSRLADLARQAGSEKTPRQRVARYITLYFDQLGKSLRGQVRPFAILSEIRALEEGTRLILTAQYQEIFRTVRAFFDEPQTADRKLLLTARTHILNEALFWSEIWLPKYAIGDFPNVCQRMMSIFDGGLATSGTIWTAKPLAISSAPIVTEQEEFLRVAIRLINEFGYKGASVARISRELNRNKASFYRKMEGKDDLVAECFRNTYHRLANLQKQARSGDASPWNRIAVMLTSALALQFQDEFPLLRASALQAMPLAVRSVAVEQSDRTALGLMGVLIDGMQEGTVRTVDPLIASQIIMSAINSSYDLKAWRKKLPLDKAIRIYALVLATGIFDPD